MPSREARRLRRRARRAAARSARPRPSSCPPSSPSGSPAPASSVKHLPPWADRARCRCTGSTTTVWRNSRRRLGRGRRGRRGRVGDDGRDRRRGRLRRRRGDREPRGSPASGRRCRRASTARTANSCSPGASAGGVNGDAHGEEGAAVDRALERRSRLARGERERRSSGADRRLGRDRVLADLVARLHRWAVGRRRGADRDRCLPWPDCATPPNVTRRGRRPRRCRRSRGSTRSSGPTGLKQPPTSVVPTRTSLVVPPGNVARPGT